MIQLRPYQITLAAQGLAVLRQHGLVYISAAVRTGKTHTSLEIARQYRTKHVLFLTKKLAIKSILSDYAAGEYPFKITVTNYENIHKTPTADVDLFVLDECHNLSQFPIPALRTKRLKAIVGYKPVIFLSATPVAEGYSKIFHQLWISARAPYGQYRNFYAWWHAGYVDVFQEKRGAFLVNNYTRADEERIKKDIAPILLTLSQDDAGFTCPVTERFIEVEDPLIPAMIKKLFKDRILHYENETILADSPGKLLGKCHQISGGTCKTESGKAFIFSQKKAEKIKELFAGKKICIFYQFIKELEVLKNVFGEQITHSPEVFQASKDKIFVGQFISAKEGLALHTADAIVMYNISYSATTYFQSRARLQALERTKPAEIYWMFTQGGLEKRVWKAVSNKLNFTYSFLVRSGGVC